MFVGDIEKMYRMIWVHPDDRNLQQILWRTSPDESFSEFQLNTITYGTAPASFIAQKCLVTIADSCENEMPEVARAIKENFYMDDLNVGTESEEKLIELGKKIRAILLKYGFSLRKFASNSRAFLDSIPSELKAASSDDKQGELAVLGVKWCPERDEIGVCENIECCETNENVLRRIALSEISKTFDPLGLFAPVLLTGKILLQEFWKEGKDWDDLTYDEINQKFCRYVENTKALCNIRIPRPICEGELMSIFAFGDASGKAYCAAIYTRYLKADGSYSCRLICSKTRVAPMKEVTIPKLELKRLSW